MLICCHCGKVRAKYNLLQAYFDQKIFDSLDKTFHAKRYTVTTVICLLITGVEQIFEQSPMLCPY